MTRASLLLLSIACLACATRSPMLTHVDPGQDLSRYRSWEWDAPRGPAQPELDERIRAAVALELGERGYHHTDGHWPELRVSYEISLIREIEVRHYTPASQFVPSFSNVTASFEVTASEKSLRVRETALLLLRVAVAGEHDAAWRAAQSTRARRDFAPHVSQSVAALFDSFPALSQSPLQLEATDLDRSVLAESSP